MASGFYNKAALQVADGTLDMGADDMELMLVTSSYVYEPNDDFVDNSKANDIIDHELTDASYARQDATVTKQQQDASNRAVFTIDPAVVWLSLAGGEEIAAAILLRNTDPDDTLNEVICYFDLSAQTSDGSNVTITFPTLAAGGICQFSVPSPLPASGWSNRAALEILDGTFDIDTDDLELMLIDNTYAYDPDDDFVDLGGATGAIAAEISPVGYSRQNTTITSAEQDANNRGIFALSDVTFSSLTAGASIHAAILFKNAGGADTANEIVAYFDMPQTDTNGNDVTLQMITSGNGGNLRLNVL